MLRKSGLLHFVLCIHNIRIHHQCVIFKDIDHILTNLFEVVFFECNNQSVVVRARRNLQRIHPLIHFRGRYCDIRFRKGDARMEPFQRRLSEARFLASRGHVSQAIDLMDTILEELPELEREMRGRIWSEKGLLYARGFRYAEAAECYGTAWRLSGRRGNCLRYLAAKRFTLTAEEYAAYISEHPELSDAARELEGKTMKAEKEWKAGPSGRQIRRLQGYLRGGQDKSFDNYAQLRIRELQDRFRADNAPSF
jgi:hypothetical protein